jgi:hypothetical protein
MWLVFGLSLLLVGLVLSPLYNTVVMADIFALENEVRNIYDSGGYALNPVSSVSTELSEGERFFYNASKGFFWSNNVPGQLEPTWIEENFTIPPFKILTIMIDCPSGNSSMVDIYYISGTSPYAVFYRNQTDDFVALELGNFTSAYHFVGVWGIAQKSGVYNFGAYAVLPTSYKTSTEGFTVTQDPPRVMQVWNVGEVETYPYMVLLPIGAVMASIGAVSSVWAYKAKTGLTGRSRKRNSRQ